MGPIEYLKKDAGISNEEESSAAEINMDNFKFIGVFRSYEMLEYTGLLFYLEVYNKLARNLGSYKPKSNLKSLTGVICVTW